MIVKPLLVELRTEEMPPLLLEKVAGSWASNLTAALVGAGVCDTGENQEHWSTPRRLAVLIADVATKSKADIRELRGPSKRISYKGNKMTPALQGFLRSSKAQEKDLIEVEYKGEPYMAVRQHVGGVSLGELLGPALEQTISKTVAPRLMREGAGQHRFVRPIRGVYALHGKQVVKALAFGAPTLKYTLGHRFLSPGKVRLANAEDYPRALLQHKVMAGTARRVEAICKQAREIEPEVIIDEGLLQEAANMCEYPACYLVEFDKAFLDLPVKVIETCMGKHLRSFAVGRGKLRNKFIFIADNKPSDDTILRKGLARVMHARLEDTQFIYDLDRQVRSEELLRRIDAINYVQGMGSMLDRSKRIENLVSEYAQPLNLQQNEIEQSEGASQYLKADLGLKLVDEYPELEGYIGGTLLDRPLAVKELIGNHLNRSLDDQPNPPRDALVLALEIERLVTIVAIDGLPKGSRDPRGLRRAMGRVIRILRRHADADLDLLLRYAWEQCAKAAQQHGALDAKSFNSDGEQVIGDLKRFAIERLTHMASDLLKLAVDKRTLNAIADPLLRDCASGSRPLQIADALMRIEALETFAQKRSEELDRLLGTAKRLSKIAGDHQGNAVKVKLLREHAEQELHKAYEERAGEVKQLIEQDQYVECCERLASLAPFVDDFFDNVMVKVNDDALRANRLNLVCQAHSLMNELIDTRKLYS